MTQTKNVGLGITTPKEACTDKKCPFHSGKYGIKKEEYVGKLIKKDVNKSATIEWGRKHYIHKYERYEKRRTRLRVHNPPCVNAAIGDTVRVMKTRPISKTKNFVIVEVLK